MNPPFVDIINHGTINYISEGHRFTFQVWRWIACEI